MNSKKRILSLIMAVLMFITFVPAQTFANTSNFVEPKQNVVNGHKEGDKLVFDVLTAKNPRRYKQQTSGFSLFRAGEAATIDQQVKIDLSTVGLGENSSAFDWSLLPDGLKVTVYFTDQSGLETEKQVVTLTQAQPSQTVTLKVPATGGTGKLHAEIPDIDNNLAIRVIRTGEATVDTKVGDGDWSFDVQVSEITNPVINLEVKDPYGKPATAAGDVQAKLHVAGLDGEPDGLDIPFTISQGNTSFNLKEAELLNGDYDLTELNYPGTSPTLTVDNEKSGKLTLGTGEDAVDYKVEKKYDIKKGGTITLTSQPKVIVPQGPSDTTPTGYVRVTFDPTSEGTITGLAQGAKLEFDVRDDVAWNDAAVTAKIPAKAEYTDDTKSFIKWQDSDDGNAGVPATGEVSTKTFTALFAADIIPFDPTNPNDPDKDKPSNDYVTVTLDANGGTFEAGTKTA
ncbi:MAG: hypothetical protein PUG50_06735, partial [Eubacteriales bacterium]|nr:hypothetical protein [Eubacteriales bacterium]